MKLYLREWRQARGLTLQQVGDAMGVHLSGVQKWELGVNGIDADTMIGLAEIYDIHPICLFLHPNDKQRATLLSKVFTLADGMDTATGAQWLNIGRAMKAQSALLGPDWQDKDEPKLEQNAAA